MHNCVWPPSSSRRGAQPPVYNRVARARAAPRVRGVRGGGRPDRRPRLCRAAGLGREARRPDRGRRRARRDHDPRRRLDDRFRPRFQLTGPGQRADGPFDIRRPDGRGRQQHEHRTQYRATLHGPPPLSVFPSLTGADFILRDPHSGTLPYSILLSATGRASATAHGVPMGGAESRKIFAGTTLAIPGRGPCRLRRPAFCRQDDNRRPRISSRHCCLPTRHWRSVSRSRMVTVPSASVWPSTVMQKGVPTSSWRR